MNDGHVSVSQGGQETVIKTETFNPQFLGLWTAGSPAHARVGFSVGTQQNFGEVKVTATVNLECDQNEKTINLAGLLAFNKALELMNDGLGILGDTK